MSTPAFLQRFEEIHGVLQANALVEVKPYVPHMTKEALELYAQDLYHKLERALSVFATEAGKMARTLDVAKELQLSKEPDVERIAEALLVAGTCPTPKEAYNKARGFIAHRAQERSNDRASSTAAPVVQVSK